MCFGVLHDDHGALLSDEPCKNDRQRVAHTKTDVLRAQPLRCLTGPPEPNGGGAKRGKHFDTEFNTWDEILQPSLNLFR